MRDFRFVILGAARIAVKFVDAVNRINGCQVVAVASKSRERANAFATENSVPSAYDDYEQMLISEKPDAAYIAVTPHDHFRLSKLCLKHNIPVLCEKSMFLSSSDAITLFEESDLKKLFVMEAMWARFLPAIRVAREWMYTGRIGTPVFAECGIGFKAPTDPQNRYFNPELGGGTAYDLVCYGWELLTWVLQRDIEQTSVMTARADTGVDATSVITLKLSGELPAVVKCSFMTELNNSLTIYGSLGKLVVPSPNSATEAYLYDETGALIEHFCDETTENGFVYEIEETIRCIREEQTESPIVPHHDTIECSRVYDMIRESLVQ